MYLNVPSKYRHQLPSLGRAWGPGMSAKGFRLPSPLVLLPVEWNSRFPTSCSPLTSVVRCKNDMFAVGVCQSRAPELWLLQFTFTSIHSSGRQGEKGRNSERARERERERERERTHSWATVYKLSRLFWISFGRIEDETIVATNGLFMLMSRLYAVKCLENTQLIPPWVPSILPPWGATSSPSYFSQVIYPLEYSRLLLPPKQGCCHLAANLVLLL